MADSISEFHLPARFFHADFPRRKRLPLLQAWVQARNPPTEPHQKRSSYLADSRLRFPSFLLTHLQSRKKSPALRESEILADAPHEQSQRIQGGGTAHPIQPRTAIKHPPCRPQLLRRALSSLPSLMSPSCLKPLASHLLTARSGFHLEIESLVVPLQQYLPKLLRVWKAPTHRETPPPIRSLFYKKLGAHPPCPIPRDPTKQKT